MADILGIGTSGLIAYQNALNTISHNISNANTDGYSRQRTEAVTRPAQGTGSGFYGAGVQVTTVQRTVDSFLIDRVRTQTTRNSELSSYYDMASRVDNMLSDSAAGLTPTLQDFFNAAQGVADTPASVPARQVMLSSAEQVVDRMHYMYENLDSLNSAMRLDVKNTVADINQYAASIADVNDQIVKQTQAFGEPPNDLLDQRDELLRKLAENVSISTVAQKNGAVNVYIGTGQTLVSGNNASVLSVTDNDYDPQDFAVTLGSVTGTGYDVTNQLNGGRLGGIVGFKKDILDPAMNQLGRVAIGLAASFNEQHVQGMTLNDVLGTDFFNDFTTPGAVEVLPSANNTGGGAVSVDIADVSKLTAGDYMLRYDGANNYTLLNYPANTVADTFTTADLPRAVDGIQIDVTTAPAAGDTFMIRPTRSAANDISLQISDPTDIAAAGAVRGYADPSNMGDATISAGELITDTTDPDYVTPAVFNTVASVNILFGTSGAGTAPYADQYSLDGGTTWNPYTSGADIKLNGMLVQVSGTPFAGDQFTMERNTGAVSDNRNALKLAELQTTDTLGDSGNGAGPTLDFQSAYGQLVSMVGTKTHQADIASTAQQTVLEQAVSARDRVSGVNLDEEAANLLKMQQGYQASSRMISAAQTLFQSLLDAVR